jgi:hypothetical protein
MGSSWYGAGFWIIEVSVFTQILDVFGLEIDGVPGT